MTLPTKDDIEQCIRMMGQEEWQIGVPDALEIAERLKGLLDLYTERGLPVEEVSIFLQGEAPEQLRTQIHTFAPGDKYKLLPEDEDPAIPVDGWEIQDIRTYVKTDV